MLKIFAVLAFLTAMTACGSTAPSSMLAKTGSPATLAISPASYAFNLDQNAPQTITVTRSSGNFTSLTLSIADPTVVGVFLPTILGSTATFEVIPIAHGTTTVSATDQNGNSATVAVSTALCGRPASLVAAQLFVPATAATGVSSAIGTLYFVAYIVRGAALSGSAHLAVGQHGSLEGGPLVAATAPPGVALPTPIPLPHTTDVIVRASVPPLAAGQHYQAQIYNDTCQPSVIAGSFST
ncbi:MAG: hypothetical protein M3Y18_04990 [Candidatus Eremiobacteraeota bacterium]|nr:hypothetical protein [Candidatus Eremiobacteraeota bacterium]